MKPTLLILAAGMGSRYGGLKQLDAVGPAGETIMDYSVYDAVRAGFGSVVFVIRERFRDDFMQKVVARYRHCIDIRLAVQEPDRVPAGSPAFPDRQKPWGTAHAMLMAAGLIDTPFAVINADDYYGRESFAILSEFLQAHAGCTGRYSMVGFRLANTLSESGTVSRGVCTADDSMRLIRVEEHHDILRQPDGSITGQGMDGTPRILPGNAYTSMNMWGFTPDIFRYAEDLFKEFLRENGGDEKKEFYIPFVVNRMLETRAASVQVLSTPDSWFGVTYQEDRPAVAEKLKQRGQDGMYPVPLFA